MLQAWLHYSARSYPSTPPPPPTSIGLLYKLYIELLYKVFLKSGHCTLVAVRIKLKYFVPGSYIQTVYTLAKLYAQLMYPIYAD